MRLRVLAPLPPPPRVVASADTPERNRPVLVQQGALSVLARMLASQVDVEVQYYCAAAVSNLAVDGALMDGARSRGSATGKRLTFCATRAFDFFLFYFFFWWARPGALIPADHRRVIAATHLDILDGLVGLLHSPAIKVQLQATLALRNLATDGAVT